MKYAASVLCALPLSLPHNLSLLFVANAMSLSYVTEAYIYEGVKCFFSKKVKKKWSHKESFPGSLTVWSVSKSLTLWPQTQNFYWSPAQLRDKRWKPSSRDAEALRQYGNSGTGNLLLFFHLPLLILWVNKSPRTQMDKRLTRLYSSLFPRSSSSSLRRRQSDLQGGHTHRWRERKSAPVDSSAVSTEAEFASIANTYSGRNVSRFSLSSSDAKLQRLQRGQREQWIA